MQEATQNPSERDFDVLAERFFSQPPHAWEIEQDDWQAEPLSSIERVAMLTTVAPVMAVLAVATALLFPESQPMSSSAMSVAPLHDESPSFAGDPQTPLVSALPAAPSPVLEAVAQLELKPLERRVAPLTVAALPRRSSKTRAAVKRARRLLDAGDPQAARDLARDVVRRAPGEAAGYIVLAGALDKLGDRAGVSATFRTCAQRATDKLASACKSLAR